MDTWRTPQRHKSQPWIKLEDPEVVKQQCFQTLGEEVGLISIPCSQNTSGFKSLVQVGRYVWQVINENLKKAVQLFKSCFHPFLFLKIYNICKGVANVSVVSEDLKAEGCFLFFFFVCSFLYVCFILGTKLFNIHLYTYIYSVHSGWDFIHLIKLLYYGQSSNRSPWCGSKHRQATLNTNNLL